MVHNSKTEFERLIKSFRAPVTTVVVVQIRQGICGKEQFSPDNPTVTREVSTATTTTRVVTVLLAKAECSQSSPDEEFVRQFARVEVSLSSVLLRPYFISPIAFTFINADRLRDALSRPEQWSGLALTSGRCVEAIERTLQLDDVPNRAELLQRWSTLAIFTVGEATRRRLLERLGLQSTGHQSGDASSLASFILSSSLVTDEKLLPPLPLLFPCSSIRSDAISTTLEGKVALEEIACYQTVANDRLEAEVQQLRSELLESANRSPTILPQLLIVVFFSPSGVDHLMPVLSRVFGLQRSDDDNSVIKVKLVAFGRSTAARLESGSQKASVWFTASRPTAEVLADELRANLDTLLNL